MRIDAYNSIGNYYLRNLHQTVEKTDHAVEDNSAAAAVDAQAKLRDSGSADGLYEQNDNESSGEHSESFLKGKDAIQDAVNRYMHVDQGLIGRNSSLESLDVQRAVSTMQKDGILREYQSFVEGDYPEDGTVRKIS